MEDIIRTTFLAAVKAYNKYDWPAVGSFLDDNVILKLPDSSRAPIYGKSNVLHYLIGEAIDKPTFDPEPYKKIISHDVDDEIGYITHLGTWVDDNHEIRNIHYAFAFINRGTKENPNWKMVLMWSNN
ncbi:MAG TPA: hypothetical protein VMF50_07760 [Candidatus Binataceae bacterium]|nr:hypothetical protein [Candidatus Binataceae bacterium]